MTIPLFLNKMVNLVLIYLFIFQFFRRADIEADYVKVFFNDSTQTFQTQDSYASSKRYGKRSCTLQVIQEMFLQQQMNNKFDVKIKI